MTRAPAWETADNREGCAFEGDSEIEWLSVLRHRLFGSGQMRDGRQDRPNFARGQPVGGCPYTGRPTSGLLVSPLGPNSLFSRCRGLVCCIRPPLTNNSSSRISDRTWNRKLLLCSSRREASRRAWSAPSQDRATGRTAFPNRTCSEHSLEHHHGRG